MSQSLFLLPEALPAIQKLVLATDQKLLNLINRTYQTQYAQYSPWMSIPFRMLHRPATFDWAPVNRLYDEGEYGQIMGILNAIDPERDTIPTHENHDMHLLDLSLDDRAAFNQIMFLAEQRLVQAIPSFQSLLDWMLIKYLPFDVRGGVRDDADDHGQAMSMLWLKGAIFWTHTPGRSVDGLAESLAHELAHQVIINYQLNDLLIKGDLNQPVYSGVRKTNRPAIASFHAAAALTYMILFAQATSNDQRKKELQDNLHKGLFALRTVAFTPIGQKIYQEMHRVL
jgi:hypothetical protein